MNKSDNVLFKIDAKSKVRLLEEVILRQVFLPQICHKPKRVKEKEWRITTGYRGETLCGKNDSEGPFICYSPNDI